MKDAIAVLEKAGFKHDDELKSGHEEQAEKNDMHQSGPYVVHGVWKKGLVTVLLEQNTAAEPMGGGMSAIIQHPPVAVISGPQGRGSCNPDDVEALRHLLDVVS
jgi:hypothetical protein